MKNIFYYGFDWSGNIGNAFIDYTVNYELKKATEGMDVAIYNMSNKPANLKYNFAIRKPFGLFGKASPFDIRTMVKADVVVLGAALFDIYWSKVETGLLKWLEETQTKVIVLGGGGGNRYSKEEVDYVKSIWKKINVVCYVARDAKAYENFSDISDMSYLGIDNAFFLKDCFKPAPLTIENLAIKTFDLTFDRKIEVPEGYTLVSLRHREDDVDSIKFARKNGLKTFSIVKDTDMISDFADDYLHLYGNSKITHSDRVHACVSTLSFGGFARYYDNSDRAYLFERVGLSEIKNKLVKLDQDFISQEKEKQLSVLKSALKIV